MPSWNRGKGRGIALVRSLVRHQGVECVLWPYSKDGNGYGQFGHLGEVYRAHKFLCQLVHGEAPDGHEAAHSCGNAACINPQHLSWKTRSENELDKRTHGTFNRGAAGGGGSRTRLTPEQIRDIRANKGRLPVHVLAKKHGLKRGGVRYWQNTMRDPAPQGTSSSAIARRTLRGSSDSAC